MTRIDFERLHNEAKLIDYAVWQHGMLACHRGEIDKLKARLEVYRKALLALNALLVDAGLPRHGAI